MHCLASWSMLVVHWFWLWNTSIMLWSSVAWCLVGCSWTLVEAPQQHARKWRAATQRSQWGHHQGEGQEDLSWRGTEAQGSLGVQLENFPSCQQPWSRWPAGVLPRCKLMLHSLQAREILASWLGQCMLDACETYSDIDIYSLLNSFQEHGRIDIVGIATYIYIFIFNTFLCLCRCRAILSFWRFGNYLNYFSPNWWVVLFCGQCHRYCIILFELY